MVQLFWVYYVLPFLIRSFAAGVVALGMNFGAYGAEIVRAGILAVPKGQWKQLIQILVHLRELKEL